MELAPIILFVYNRPWHTKQTLAALEKNLLAKESELYIYADGPKNDISSEQLQKINEVRKVIRNKWEFKAIHIVERNENVGLANNVINGVTDVINKHGKIIVLEDDLLTSQGFLKYMNEALNRYEYENKVMQISGYQFPVKFSRRIPDTFLIPITTSWGWATWKRSWNLFDPNATGYQELKTNKELRYKFNFDDSHQYAKMLESQMESKSIDSWAIRWWWSVFKQGGLVLYSKESLIKNIGFGEEATHTSNNDNSFLIKKLKHRETIKFTDEITINNSVNELIKDYLKDLKNTQTPNLFARLFHLIKLK